MRILILAVLFTASALCFGQLETHILSSLDTSKLQFYFANDDDMTFVEIKKPLEEATYVVFRGQMIDGEITQNVDTSMVLEFSINSRGNLCGEYVQYGYFTHHIIDKRYYSPCEENSLNEKFYYFDEQGNKIAHD